MAPYVQMGVSEELTATIKPSQEVIDKIIKAIKTDVLEGTSHLNQGIRYAIKVVLWQSQQFKDMDAVAKSIDLVKPFVVVDPKVIKAYQKVRFLSQDGIVGPLTAAQLVKDMQQKFQDLSDRYGGKPPAKYDFTAEFNKLVLMPPVVKPPVVTYRPPTYVAPAPEPVREAQKYTSVTPPAGTPTTIYAKKSLPTQVPSRYADHYSSKGGSKPMAIRQTRPVNVRATFSMAGLATTIVGSIAAMYILRGIQTFGPAAVAWVKKNRKRKR